MQWRRTIGVFVVLIFVASLVAAFYYSTSISNVFALNVYPQQIRGESIPGQLVVFLISVSEEASSGGPVTITADAPGAAVWVEPQSIKPGQIGEVTVIPMLESIGKNITLNINAERNGYLVQNRNVSFTVAGGEDMLKPYAIEIRDKFVSWLQANRPELGITNTTQWIGTIVSPVWLVVSHYLFFSQDWEIHVYWHVMIAPYDWARIDLRHRFNSSAPSLSFEISSLSGETVPHSIEPPAEVWR